MRWMQEVQGHEGRDGEMLGFSANDSHLYPSPLYQEEEGVS